MCASALIALVRPDPFSRDLLSIDPRVREAKVFTANGLNRRV